MSDSTPQVLQEIRDGHALGMAQAARMMPGVGGGSCDPSTLFRWATSGVKTTTGARIKLEAVRVGRRLITSGPALERFVMATTAGYSTDPTPAPRTPAARRKAVERAERKLIEMGA
ncbi:MAG: DUF1580 domain-containing protein [Gemmataceae bacterium]|nr:DUF1580 domain-containing protein [Gemmataceae bacterium]